MLSLDFASVTHRTRFRCSARSQQGIFTLTAVSFAAVGTATAIGDHHMVGPGRRGCSVLRRPVNPASASGFQAAAGAPEGDRVGHFGMEDRHSHRIGHGLTVRHFFAIVRYSSRTIGHFYSTCHSSAYYSPSSKNLEKEQKNLLAPVGFEHSNGSLPAYSNNSNLANLGCHYPIFGCV